MKQFLDIHQRGNWLAIGGRTNVMSMSPQNVDPQTAHKDNKPVNQLRRDGFAAITIALISGVLIFVMFNHFVS